MGKASEAKNTSPLVWVHPHPRGESSSSIGTRCTWYGSPPPAWGKLFQGSQGQAPDRFTPTRVGKAKPHASSSNLFLVHPHPRGESTCGTPCRGQLAGSPPPAWGKHPAAVLCQILPGFTPTRVGKANFGVGLAQALRVHPHPRGESAPLSTDGSDGDGSPPPAWGKHDYRGGANGKHRFTPTRVGKARATTTLTSPVTVHPHPRGESMIDAGESVHPVGSPPPAWGKPPGRRRRCRSRWFTPTRVGKAGCRGHSCARGWVHPHPRGESILNPVGMVLLRGSPPPAWGKLLRASSGGWCNGFTPTRVGKAS